jgi:lysophospholipase L1-like esterase
MKRLIAVVTMLVTVPMAVFGSAAPQRPLGITDQPCPAAPAERGALTPRLARLLEPGAVQLPPDPDRAAANQRAEAERLATDWAQLCRYEADNRALVAPVDGERRVVFMGDSITEFWKLADPALFSAGVIDRGISGQTTGQMLLRFRQDVVALRPVAVHLMAGTNDIAGNSGPTTVETVQANIQSMVEMAEAHGITVVLASVPPAADFSWRPGLKPAPTIQKLNAWLRRYAADKGIRYVDYHAVLADGAQGLKKSLANDGVHPNRDGYALMKPLAESAIAAARKGKGP